MSIWTHVAGVVRLDALRIPGIPQPNPKFAYKGVPYGSEGPLEVIVWENPAQSAMAAYTITVFGDLRDYDEEDAEDVIAYFDQLANGGLPVRNACFTVETEYGKERLFLWRDEKFVEVAI